MFVHGTRLTRAQWLPQLRRLSDRYRCIAIDLPGHGERAGEPFTMAAASDAVVAAIEAEATAGRAVIVGLSLGGYVAIETAERCPERVAGLVLAGCSAEPVGSGRGGLPGVRRGGSSTPRAAGSASSTGASSGSATAPGSRTPSSPAASGRSAAPRRCASSSARASSSASGGLWTPVLVVNGALDPVFGPGGDPWAAACRRGRHVVLSRAMHLANLDRPGAFSDLVAAFVADPAGGA